MPIEVGQVGTLAELIRKGMEDGTELRLRTYSLGAKRSEYMDSEGRYNATAVFREDVLRWERSGIPVGDPLGVTWEVASVPNPFPSELKFDVRVEDRGIGTVKVSTEYRGQRFSVSNDRSEGGLVRILMDIGYITFEGGLDGKGNLGTYILRGLGEIK